MTLLFAALIIATLAILSLGLGGLATLEYKIADLNGQNVQLTQMVQSGIVAVAEAVDDPGCFDLFHNAERFHRISILPADFPAEMMSGTDSIESGRFTVFSPDEKQGQRNGIRFGLMRESAKLSLETILEWEKELPGQGVQALETLPGMTPEIADSLLDWLDADDQARPQGAEADYYQQQKKSYRSRNAVPVTLEELLLIRGIERPLVFGNDPSLTWGATQAVLRSADSMSINSMQAGQMNPFAPLPTSDSGLPSPQNSGTQEESAWQWMLTPYSAEKLVNAQGSARIFLNEADLEFLESQLRLHQIEEVSIRFIIAWRKEKGNIDDPIDLLDTEIIVGSETLPSPFSCMETIKYEAFLRLLDEATTEPTVVLRGRINVNEAPKQVLEAVPELTPERVAIILERRESSTEKDMIGSNMTSKGKEGGRHRHAVWLLAEEIVDKETMKTLSRRLTTGGDVYRFQVAAFFEGNPLLNRAEAVLDATVKPPKTVFYQDLTALPIPE